jgi:hypothetical protein
MSYFCIGNCYPPASTFPFWDLVTGNAPSNEYSIIGYQMLMTGHIIMVFLIPVVFIIFYESLKLLEDLVPGKFDINGRKTEVKS